MNRIARLSRTAAVAAAALTVAALAAALPPAATAPVPTPAPAAASAVAAPGAASPSRPLAGPNPLTATGTAVRINGTTYVPCAEEDYDGPTACFWDAGVRGNGTGRSFTWDGTQVRYTS